MNFDYEKWQSLKNNYLKQVEQALASINHPKSGELLHDVDEHLENKYAELPLDQQNWEGCQQILIEMGPPSDYAELLAEDKPLGKISRFPSPVNDRISSASRSKRDASFSPLSIKKRIQTSRCFY